MIEEEAYVAEIVDGVAWIEKQRQTACSVCSAACPTSMFGGLAEGKRVRLPIPSSLPLQPGQTVLIGLPETALARGSVLIYLWPLIGFFSAALWCSYQGLSDFYGFLGGLAGTGLCYAGLRLRRTFDRKEYQPVILRRID